MRMLIIEDDEQYLGLLARYLDGLADEINIAKTWEEAERFVEVSAIMWIDLIIPPWGEEQGYIKIGEYRERNKNAVIFVVSGLPDNAARDKSLNAGADAYAEKMDVVKQTQVIALMISALMKAQEKGIPESLKFLEKARMLIAEKVNPNPE